MPTSSSSSHSSLAAPPPETNLFDLTSDDDSFEAVSPSPAARVPAVGAGAATPAAGRSPASHRKAGSSTLARPDGYMSPATGHRRRKSSFAAAASTPNRGHNRSPSAAIVEGGGSSPFEVVDESSSLSSDAERQKDEDDDELGLSTAERAEKRKQRQKNLRMEREEPMGLSPRAKREALADRNIAKQLLVNCGLILLWYLFSLSISLYNKWMFDKERLNFSFPLFTTATHMLVQFGLASLVLYFFPALRPGHKRASDRGRSRHDEPNAQMTKWFYLTRVGPCGAATSLDIGLGNMSLEFISLTFYTMCKSSSLAFVLLFAFIFRLETPTWRLVAIIATMTIGVILMVSGEVKFDAGGFILVISAAFFSGFRWALTQLLLLRNSATSNPFSSIFFLSPVMFVTLFAMAVPIEGFGPLFVGLGRLTEKFGSAATPFIVLFPGCIAFLMIASEFALLQRTSVVTLSIAGIFKEVLTISVASVVFDDKLTLVNFVGLIVTLVAIIAYNYVKITKMRADETAKLYREEDEAAVPLQAVNRERGGNDDEDLGLLHEDSDDEPASSSNVQSATRIH